MSFFKSFKHLLKASPFVRWTVFILTVLFLIFISIFIGRTVYKKPVINSIDPAVGAPGDVMVIEGSNFGLNRGSSYVEVAGSRLTSSSYVSWTDKMIKVILPVNVQDGLVLVKTGAGKSDPGFFANKTGIPTAVRTDRQVTVPVITSISPEKAGIGQTIVITGSNFGSERSIGQVFFTANRDDFLNAGTAAEQSSIATGDSPYIAASEFDFDYEFWSDTEIHVRVPDGAASGNVFVLNHRGQSQNAKMEVSIPGGSKKYANRRTYVVKVTCDISKVVPSQDSSITLYVPRPPVYSSQPQAELNEYNPDPLIIDDPDTIIYNTPLNLVANHQEYSQSYVMRNYAVQCEVSPRSVANYVKDRSLYSAYTNQDMCVPSNATIVESLRTQILGKERNPYNMARLIYNYMVDNYKVVEQDKKAGASALDLPKHKKGDPYDFAVMFTALCRSAGIPAVPVSGILLENDMQTKVHWWSEIYFENFGWFPVDPALGAGLEYKSFISVEDPKSFYFGNLDSQHIAFSRGWKQIRPSLLNSKTVCYNKSYGLLSIWEEASDATSGYSSLWNVPSVVGIY